MKRINWFLSIAIVSFLMTSFNGCYTTFSSARTDNGYNQDLDEHLKTYKYLHCLKILQTYTYVSSAYSLLLPQSILRTIPHTGSCLDTVVFIIWK